MNLEQKAQEFATMAHTGQLRKDGKTPYINHCYGVVRLLKEIGIGDENILCSAWLHDVIEDCGIEKEFNKEIARIVFVLTRNVNRERYKERIKNADFPIQIVKLADTVHNCSELERCLDKGTIKTKVKDCEEFYFDLARRICPEFYEKLVFYIRPYTTRLG